MRLGEKIINAITARRHRKFMSARRPHRDFYRNGGNELLYDLPVTTGELVVDAGGYKGEWTAAMVVRYGCRSEIFEPVPSYADHCKSLFGRNALIRVHAAALGRSSRITQFCFSDNGTSEFKFENGKNVVEAPVIDVSHFFSQFGDESVACLKLNIEGGEYEVLERLLETNQIICCRSLQNQKQRQPKGKKKRRKDIEARLRLTHVREWCYPLVWEKWVLLDSSFFLFCCVFFSFFFFFVFWRF